MNINEQSIELHRRNKGKLEIKSKIRIQNKEDLSLAYTPGVAAVSGAIARNKKEVFELTIKQNSVAVISDGSAVLGLGNIGPEAAMPVMEGKAILFKEFAGIDAYPICLATQDSEKIIETIKYIATGFGGINLEDISAPRCFDIENALRNIGIPVMHDDQHGTAVVVYAALLNALNVTGKKSEDIRIAISGSGAAGIAIAKMINSTIRLRDMILCDSEGAIYNGRPNLNDAKKEISKTTNKEKIKGPLSEAIKNTDVFIGVSKAGIVTKEMIMSMNVDPIVFAMANPVPEIMPDEAKKAGAIVVGTGRSDFPNQINNVLGFPGIFRGALDAKALRINYEMKLAAANALASCIKPIADSVLPNAFDKSVVPKVAKAVKEAAVKSGMVRDYR